MSYFCIHQVSTRYLVFILSFFFISFGCLYASNDSLPTDSLANEEIRVEAKEASGLAVFPTVWLPGKIHRIGIDYRPEYILKTNSFVKGENPAYKPLDVANSIHLKYSFLYKNNPLCDSGCKGVYQGIGLSYFNFGESEHLGNPIAFYLFQGATIASFSPKVSLNYEWNFGLSMGWKPYNEITNEQNTVIGSKVNAFMNLNFYLKWALSPQVEMTSGLSVSHFSNGNTQYPNRGLNTAGLNVGLIYNLNRENREKQGVMSGRLYPPFKKHVSYDAVAFGAWRKQGISVGEMRVALPDAYAVAGLNFAPMYNFFYNFRAGVSLDVVYDASANIRTADYIMGSMPEFYKPGVEKQSSVGLSARGELVMPFFRVNFGLGANLYGPGDMRGTYQVLALKMEVTRSSFIHIGYNLKDFHLPNFLMLGIGYRFHDKFPDWHRK
ncbi:MAG: acyloxyacyl hydrolase [Dysgonamonadaceae bacterium]